MEKLQNKTPLVKFPEFNCGWEHKELNELLSVPPAGARLSHSDPFGASRSIML